MSRHRRCVLVLATTIVAIMLQAIPAFTRNTENASAAIAQDSPGSAMQSQEGGFVLVQDTVWKNISPRSPSEGESLACDEAKGKGEHTTSNCVKADDDCSGTAATAKRHLELACGVGCAQHKCPEGNRCDNKPLTDVAVDTSKKTGAEACKDKKDEPDLCFATATATCTCECKRK